MIYELAIAVSAIPMDEARLKWGATVRQVLDKKEYTYFRNTHTHTQPVTLYLYFVILTWRSTVVIAKSSGLQVYKNHVCCNQNNVAHNSIKQNIHLFCRVAILLIAYYLNGIYYDFIIMILIPQVIL